MQVCASSLPSSPPKEIRTSPPIARSAPIWAATGSPPMAVTPPHSGVQPPPPATTNARLNCFTPVCLGGGDQVERREQAGVDVRGEPGRPGGRRARRGARRRRGGWATSEAGADGDGASTRTGERGASTDWRDGAVLAVADGAAGPAGLAGRAVDQAVGRLAGRAGGRWSRSRRTEPPGAMVASQLSAGHRDLAAVVGVGAVPQAGDRRAGRQLEAQCPAGDRGRPRLVIVYWPV